MKLVTYDLAGVFNFLIAYPELQAHTRDISSYYYLGHSGNKRVSATYKNCAKLLGVVDIEEMTDEQKENVNNKIAVMIQSTYAERWLKIYSAMASEYKPLSNFDMKDTTTETGTNTTTYGKKTTEQQGSEERLKYDNTIQDNGKEATKTTVERNVTDNDSTFGFNSTEAVDRDMSTSTDTETTTANKDDNTTENTRTKSGTDIRSLDGENIEQLSGSDTSQNDVTKDKAVSIQKGTGAELLTAELDFRSKYLFYDIVSNDVDKILSNLVY